jgi:peptidyl-Asp metalloendopeptidase
LAAVPGALAWTFDVGDYNKDGKPDLYAFKKVGGGSGKTEVHIYSGADGFTTVLGDFALPMPSTGDDDAWEFRVADVDRDGIPDVVAIAKKNGVTTEVHVVSGASNYTSYSLETGTALPGLGSDSRWVFGINDYDADGQADLFAINKIGTQGLEVHVLKGNAYQDYLLHAATPLGTMPSDSSKTLLINR